MKFHSAFAALIVCAATYNVQSFNLGKGVGYVQKQQQHQQQKQILNRPWGKVVTTSTTCISMSTAEPPSSPVVVKRLENSAVQIEIPVSGKATKAAYDKVCMELSKQLTLPGFRKGSKIPPQVLEQTLVARGGGRNAIKVQAINELVTQLVPPTLKDQSLEPIGAPTLQVSAETLAETFVAGNEITLQVTCDVWPEIQWQSPLDGQSKPYYGLQGSYKRKPFNQDKLNASLRDLRERYASIEPIEDNDEYKLTTGDACIVNMVGYMATNDGTKGELLPNAASGDNVEVIIGPGRYMEGLVEGLVGHKKGETVTVSVTFPEKLRDKTLAGKKALFDVEIVQCSKRTVPEVNDDFAETVKAGLTSEALLAELRNAIDEEDSKDFVPARNAALGKALATRVEVDVPDTLITNQARDKFAVMMAEMRDNGVGDDVIKQQINPDNFAKYKAIVKDDIVRDFKVSMATDEIARLEGITVPDYQVEEQMEAIRKDADGSEDFDENMIRMKVETTIQRQLVMEMLAKESKLEVSYEDDKFDESLLEQLAQDTLKAVEADTIAVTSTPTIVETVAKTIVEEQPAPVVAQTVVKVEEAAVVEKVVATEKPIEIKGEMSLQEKAFAALFNSGAIKINKSPDDPDYDSSNDDKEAPENTFIN